MENFVIRHAIIDDAAGIARVRAESWRAAYRGIVPDSYLDSIDVDEWAERQRRNMEEQPDNLVSLVAETQGLIAGWAASGPNRDPSLDYAGELYTIYLLPEYQRRGIGSALIASSARWLVSQGMDSMILWVLEENHPARSFYEALGGQLCGSRQTQIAGPWLPEVAYGWTDLVGLIAGGAEAAPPA